MNHKCQCVASSQFNPTDWAHGNKCVSCGGIISPGKALGRLAKGKPKNFTKAERKRRAERLAAARLKRWPAKSNPRREAEETRT